MDIKELLKRLTGDSFVYSIATISTRLISFILFPFFARQFSPEEYGAIGLLNAFGLLLGTLSTMGMDSASARWFYDSEEPGYRKKAFQSWMLVQVSILTTVYLLVLLFASVFPLDNLLQAQTPLLLVSVVILNLSLAMPQHIIHLYLVLNRHRYHAMWISIASAGISAAASILLVFVFRLGILGFFLGQTVAFAICGLVASFIWLKKVISFSFPGINFLKPMAKYGLAIIPANISSLLLLFISSVIITQNASQTSLGYFQVGYTLATGLLLFTMPFNQAFQPLSFSIMEKPESGKFFSWVLDMYVIALSSICLIVGLFFPEIVGLLLTDKYLPSDFVAATLLFSNFIYSLTVFALIALAKMKKMKYFSIVVASSNFLILLLVYLGTTNFGINGAALSFLVGNTLTTLFLFYISRRIYPYPFRYLQNGLLVILSLGLFFIGYKVSGMQAAYSFQIRILLMCTFLGVVLFYLFKNRFFINVKQFLKFT